MANSENGKHYPSSSIQNSQGNDHSRGFRHRDMVLNVEAKSDSYPTDETPTPNRLIQKCEEMGLFHDLPTINPFEETFRKAAEDIRSGTTPLEMSCLTLPNNSDDSLHTPHVIFPNPNEVNKRRRPISPGDDLSISIIQHDSDPLDMSLGDNTDDDGDDDDPGKLVVQQEADTSEDTQKSLNAPTSDDVASLGTIQFLLRMPNGKMVQLSSLPVEQMDSASEGAANKDIPIIKVDSSFLKTVSDDSKQEIDNFISAPSGLASTNASRTGNVTDFCDSHDVNKPSNNLISKRSPSIPSRMSLAKQKLKQALMNNSCPATNAKSSPGPISSSGTNSSPPKSPPAYSQCIETMKESHAEDQSNESDWMEEKRKRNRAAAMRCREKRKTWVKELERRANDMLRTNGQLQHEVSMLRDEVAQLKTLLLAHRDCPVTQAMVQGKTALPPGTTTLITPVANNSSSASKTSTSKALKSPPLSSGFVIQTPAMKPVKPLIVLNDPPAKRKRLNSSTSHQSTTLTGAGVSVVSSPPLSSPLHTSVLPSKNLTVLNSSFLNVIPSVLVANPTTSASNSLGPSQLIYSQILPCLPTIQPKPSVVGPRPTYILPKSRVNTLSPEKIVGKGSRPEGRVHTHLLSTNVIKINPNVVERDSNDSDIEILDVK